MKPIMFYPQISAPTSTTGARYRDHCTASYGRDVRRATWRPQSCWVAECVPGTLQGQHYLLCQRAREIEESIIYFSGGVHDKTMRCQAEAGFCIVTAVLQVCTPVPVTLLFYKYDINSSNTCTTAQVNTTALHSYSSRKSTTGGAFVKKLKFNPTQGPAAWKHETFCAVCCCLLLFVCVGV